MKRNMTRWTLLIAALVVVAAPALAFHDGGVADCAGCHSMHNSPANSGPLMTASDKSSVCLECHEASAGSYHIATPAADLATSAPFQRTPGGDFAWVRDEMDRSWTAWGTPRTVYGYERGHNIVAADFGYIPDPDPDSKGVPGNLSVPAGYLNDFACSDCHDPHGKTRLVSDGAGGEAIFYPVASFVGTYPPTSSSGSYGAVPTGTVDNSGTGAALPSGFAVGTYRLLGGTDYVPRQDTGGSPITLAGIPRAVSPSSYNNDELNFAGQQTRVAYGTALGAGTADWGAWCGSCHQQMHNPTLNVQHEVDVTFNGIYATNYNKYVGTGVLTSLDTVSYNSLVPFAQFAADTATLATYASPVGATVRSGPGVNGVGAEVTCLSCHRAHASGWQNALRWNNENEYLTEGTWGAATYPSAAGGGQGYNDTEQVAAYNGRPAAAWTSPYQRSLCNKCHIQD